MCMESITKIENPPKLAYKVLVNGHVGPYSDTQIARGVWMEAKNEPQHKTPTLYPPGFHVFATRSDAECYARIEAVVIRDFTIEEVEIAGPAYMGLACGMCAYSVNRIRFKESKNEKSP